MKKNVFYLITISFLLMVSFNSCSSGEDGGTQNGPFGDNNNNGNNINEWLIPVSEVKDGGPGKDGIPSIDNPKFITAAEASFMDDWRLVIGIKEGGEARAYPHIILDWHEVVNDAINNNFITISYCPLTGTSFGWKSIANGVQSNFGVSGLLYNTNLILYDRNTDSNWSQLRLQCVNGPLISDRPILTNVVETDWGTWKSLYPDTKVLSLDTGFSRSYGVYPYGDYRTNHDFFLFTPSPLNPALPNKERIFAILTNDKSKVYKFSSFGNGKAIVDNFLGQEYLLVGDKDTVNAFKLSAEYSNLVFEYDFSGQEVFFKDNEGNAWTIFGEAVEGPRTGEVLQSPKKVVSFWFAIAAFYPNPQIFTE